MSSTIAVHVTSFCPDQDDGKPQQSYEGQSKLNINEARLKAYFFDEFCGVALKLRRSDEMQKKLLKMPRGSALIRGPMH
jgi:hypothetical protein